MHSSSFLAYFLLVLSLAAGALAQVQMASCLAGWEWNRNSLDQDPCKIGSMLDANCRGIIQYNYTKLEQGQSYVTPSKNHTGDMDCDCNSVIYSLIMACATCQNGLASSWDMWSSACDTVYVKQYPRDYPQGTAVPHWAFVDVTTLAGGTYSNGNAESVGRDPEVFPKKLNTKTATGGPGSTGAVIGSSSGHRNVGAIAGGVVGGIIALAILIAIIAFFIVRRNRRNRDQSFRPQSQHQEAPSDYWKASPTSPSYDPSILSGTTAAPNYPFQPYNPGNVPGIYQADPTQNQQHTTYVTPISNYPDRR